MKALRSTRFCSAAALALLFSTQGVPLPLQAAEPTANQAPIEPAPGAAPSLTLYNQDFAVVREGIRLDLKAGSNQVTYDDVTGLLEPDSVVLRDPAGKRQLRVQEQRFLADIASSARLLKQFEGKWLDFIVTSPGGESRIVPGKLLRAGSGNAPGWNAGSGFYGQRTPIYVGADIVEVEGKVRFGLPGVPLFPRDAIEGMTLRPTLSWTLLTNSAGPLNAEIAYVTGGFNWHADYNVIAPEKGDDVDLIGWVTMVNNSGRTFENARIKLMAGDLMKLAPPPGFGGGGFGGGMMTAPREPMQPAVTEKSFDEYHLYTLQSPTTLQDRETKQVEFARAEKVRATRLYVYDGAKFDPNRSLEGYQNERSYGALNSNTKVWVMREIDNIKKNGLGIPLPAGRLRFYRRDDADGSLEFVGENRIKHTPRDEKVRLYTGNAFDIVGERRQLAFQYDEAHREYTIEETYEVKIRNRKTEPVEVRVVEHLWRYSNWYLFKKSDPYSKLDSATIEFRVPLKPDEERTVTYTVRYTPWPVEESGRRVVPPPPAN